MRTRRGKSTVAGDELGYVYKVEDRPWFKEGLAMLEDAERREDWTAAYPGESRELLKRHGMAPGENPNAHAYNLALIDAPEMSASLAAALFNTIVLGREPDVEQDDTPDGVDDIADENRKK